MFKVNDVCVLAPRKSRYEYPPPPGNMFCHGVPQNLQVLSWGGCALLVGGRRTQNGPLAREGHKNENLQEADKSHASQEPCTNAATAPS